VSQTRWETRFKPARYGRVVDASDSPVRELLDPGDLAPIDLLGHEARHFLSQDSVIRGVVDNRHEFMPWRPVFNFTEFPRFAVYLSSSIDTEQPTLVSVEKVSLYIAAFWDAQKVEPIKDGNPSVATFMQRVKHVLRQPKARRLVVYYAGQERALSATNIEFQGERFAPIQMADRLAFVNELQVGFEQRLDSETGRIAGWP